MSWSISADGANRAQVLAQFAERIAASDGTPKDGSLENIAAAMVQTAPDRVLHLSTSGQKGSDDEQGSINVYVSWDAPVPDVQE
jgi:hypothetical protein